MGFFSFITQDTNESIPNRHSGKDMGTIFIHLPDGTVHETAYYNGYGDFGVVDFMFLMDRINRKNPRPLNPCDDTRYERCIQRGNKLYWGKSKKTVFPNITRNRDWTWRNERPSDDPLQGFFYPKAESND